MSKSNDLDDIFRAMEEIDLLSEKRKKDKEVLILDKNQEIGESIEEKFCKILS